LKQLVAPVVLAASAACFFTAVPVQPAFAAQHAARLAPADEYFGPLRISILGIHNMLRDQSARLAADPGASNAVFGMIGYVELALRDLERKYPDDTALPGSIYHLERLYAALPIPAALERAQRTERWLFERYPGALAAQQLREELAAHPLPRLSAASEDGSAASAPAGEGQTAPQ
jgi:hypothetical protein